MDEVRVPGNRGYNSDLEMVSAYRLPGMLYTHCYEKDYLVHPETGREWIITESQRYRRRYRVLQVTARVTRLSGKKEA